MHIPTALYKKIVAILPVPCVDVAIVANGRVLIVKRKDAPARGQWWLPGGRVFKGEMMKDTAHRKAIEEVGIECHVGPVIYTAETIFPDGPFDIPIHSINSCFFMYPTKSDFRPELDTHHSEFKWVNKIERGLHPYIKRCLLAAGL